jgi:hypothetical protein
MDQSTRDNFNATYKGLLDQLNEKKKAGIKFDFAHELKLYERDNELDTIAYFRVRPVDSNLSASCSYCLEQNVTQSAPREWVCSSWKLLGGGLHAPVHLVITVQGFMQQVKQLPPPETKQEREARLSAPMSVVVPAPVDDDDVDDADHLLPGPDEIMHGEAIDEDDQPVPVRRIQLFQQLCWNASADAQHAR